MRKTSPVSSSTRFLLLASVAWHLAVPASLADHCDRDWSKFLPGKKSWIASGFAASLLFAGGFVAYAYLRKPKPKQDFDPNQLPKVAPDAVRECIEKQVAKYRQENPLAHYAPDGCNLRAADLIRQIKRACLTDVVAQIWIKGVLLPCQNVGWDWHTAGAFRDEQGQVYVVDPALSSKPIKLDTWEKACVGLGSRQYIRYSECYGAHVTPEGPMSNPEAPRCAYACYGQLAIDYLNCDARADTAADCAKEALSSCVSCAAKCPGSNLDCAKVPRGGYLKEVEDPAVPRWKIW